MSKDSGPKATDERSSYGYSHGGGYAGYSEVGYGYEAGGTAHRSFQDYMLILRERIWYIVVVFLVVFSSVLVYTLNEPKIYQSSATVQIFRRETQVIETRPLQETNIQGMEDLNTQIKVIESSAIIRRVAERITGDDLKAFLAPHGRTTAELDFVMGVLAGDRRVVLQRMTLMVQIAYQHQDRFVAAKVANLFAEAYIDHNLQQRSNASAKAVDDLKNTVAEQQKQVEQMARNLQGYKEKNNMVSLDQRKDIVTESLRAVNAEVNRIQLGLSSAEIRLNQIKERRASGGDLTELPFIASQPLISQLVQQLAGHKILIAQLRERYKELHPKMIAAAQQLKQTESELQRAVDNACALAESEYQAALRNFQQSKDDLRKRTEESLELERAAVEYNNKDRELRTNEAILQNIVARSRETTMVGQIQTQNAQIVDRAAVPAENRPVSPNVPMNLIVGTIGGLALGLAFAFFVAFIDDRVKSSFDIEGVVGLPLIGIIPQIKRMEQADKAQIVATNADRQVAEAFLTLHSSLRLKDESKNAKCILTTSTIPGEGKSFTTTNLALTFAAHGERVIVIDCDLRKPNVHKSFRIENLKGVIDVASGKAAIDDVVVKNVHPNLDVMPAGGRAKNPTQILNSKGFEILISDLRKKYDRVFIDTPPLAAVSDALIILPLTDGSIFTIFFNKVRRKAAQFAAKKLLEANVPNFGAVLNGLNLAVSGYYYAQYYDKSYKDYYVVMAKQDPSSPDR